MIKKFFSNRHRPGWKYDSKQKRYWSWGFDIRLSDRRRKREAGFLSQAEVEAVLARIRLAERDQRYGFVTPAVAPTVRELADKHVTKLTSHKEQVRARRVLKTLCEEIPETLKVNELLTTHLEKFVERRQYEGQAPSSVDRELNIISSALNSAADYYPQELHNWNTPKIPRPKHSKRRRERVIKAAEVAKLLTWLYSPQRHDERDARAANRRNVGHVFRCALLTGARKGELCKLRWDQVDWGAMVIQIVGTKTEKRAQQTVRYLKITPPIAEILNERLALSRGGYVFTRAGGEVTDYYEIMGEAKDALGLAYGKDVIGGFVTHDARHTAVTRMLQAGCDLATIGSITGHKDKTLVLRYAHASNESRGHAMEVLEKFAGNENLGLGLDSVGTDALIYSGNQRVLVPEVGLEPT
ncbi:MAG TPA: site-specific integrase [Pyrinomonadaceae bacterium]